MRFSVFALAALTAGTSAISPPNHEANRNLFKIPGGDSQEVATMANATFTQLTDHNDPSCGTFEQFYMYDTTYWKGPGSPIVLFTPGEINATGYTSYLTTKRITGLVAERVGAAVIVLEHRYWGTSTPFTDFTSANLTYLTLENAIYDLTYFAKNVKLPFAKDIKTNAEDVPWLMIGGSYSGALARWTESVAPGTFWAYQCSSGPVQSISNYYGYFLPIEEGMAKNCSKDLNLVVEHMDNVFEHGTAKEIHELKTMFGLESVEHADDIMEFLSNGVELWQGNQFYENAGFFDMCDYVENSVNVTDPSKLPGAEGVGLQKALEGYARFSKEYYLPDYCSGTYGYFPPGSNTECLNSYNPNNPIFTDRSPSNTADRQWVWMTCNQPFGYWQGGAPAGKPYNLASRLVNPEYFIRQCGLYFPDGYGIAEGRTEAQVNMYDGGWTVVNSTRLIYGNGGYDPWREATVSSDLRPEGPLESTAAVPVNIVPGGFHCSDLITENGQVNAGCQSVIDKEVDFFAQSVREWHKTKRSWTA